MKESKMNELSKCPFCGKQEAEVVEDYANSFIVVCGFCTSTAKRMSSPDRAIKEWNKRKRPNVYEPLQISVIEEPRFNPAFKSVRLPKNQDVSKYSTEETMNLLSKLIRAGDDHAKAARGIDVTIELKCQTGWLIEYLTYTVGVTPLSSSSSMHNELKELKGAELANQKQWDLVEKVYTRNEKITYQTLRRIYKQRLGHRHPDWKIFTNWIEELPLFDELIMPQKKKVSKPKGAWKKTPPESKHKDYLLSGLDPLIDELVVVMGSYEEYPFSLYWMEVPESPK